MADATCKTCPWWFCTDDTQKIQPGQCRRNPPEAQKVLVNRPTARESISRWELSTFFPFVNDLHWCGEHPERQTHLECAMTTLVTHDDDGPTEADVRRIVDALEKIAICARRWAP